MRPLSPDINFIENVWGFLPRSKYKKQYNSAEDLIKELKTDVKECLKNMPQSKNQSVNIIKNGKSKINILYVGFCLSKIPNMWYDGFK